LPLRDIIIAGFLALWVQCVIDRRRRKYKQIRDRNGLNAFGLYGLLADSAIRAQVARLLTTADEQFFMRNATIRLMRIDPARPRATFAAVIAQLISSYESTDYELA